MADEAQLLLDRLEQAGSRIRGRDGRWMAQCPAHPDRTPSLSITETGDRLLIHCFAGCETEHVLDRLDLRYHHLYNRPPLTGPGHVPGKELPPQWAREIHRVDFAVDVLLEHAFNAPTCRPSQALIAAELRHLHGWTTTRETVNRACAWLKQHGYISWTQERAPGAKWRHNVYTLLCTWTRPLRRRLLDRLDTLKSRFHSRSYNHSLVHVPFSVITPRRSGEAASGEHEFGRVLAQQARAGP